MPSGAAALAAKTDLPVRWEMLHFHYSHNGGNVKRKSSDRGDTKNVVTPVAVGITTAADRIGPMVHYAADRVGPLAQSAADKAGPLAQRAADVIAPLAQSAADRWLLTHQAVGRVSPMAHQAVGYVGPYAAQAAGYVTPIAQQAVERVTPLAKSAKLQGTRVAHGAAELVGPHLDDARNRVTPVVDAARGRVNDDLVLRISTALTAAATSPIAAEATRRGRATWAAARGELDIPVVVDVPDVSGRAGWVKRLAVVAALGGVAVLAAKKLLGSKDADWQAARPAATFPTSRTTEEPTTVPQSTGTADSSAPLNWAAATGQTDTGADQPLDESSERRIVEHVGEPSDAPAEAAPTATVAEGAPPKDVPAKDMPVSEAPSVADAAPSADLPASDVPRTSPGSDRT